jgi:deoxyadenosine/deoxycytidine kinase
MKFSSMSGWSKHITVHHPGLKPKGYTDMQFLYYCITGKTHGSCIQCGKDTTWNESNGKYNRFCNNPKCKQEYTKIAKQRMIDKYGKAHLLNDPNMQRKMLKNKSISGSYKFSNKSGFVDYVGSYEKDFLYVMDHIMGFSAKDIMGPSPHNYIYMYEGKAHVYIPDFYIPNYNLEIEIKTDENMHHKIQAVDKVKEKLKDEVMSKNPSVNYFKILDKDYTEFFKYLTDKKFEIDDAAMENIHEYMQSKNPKVDAALEEAEPATENILFSKKDTVKNIDKWKPGPNNILFVTGFSGSGKTSLAEEYEKKYNAHMFELDGIEHGYDSSGMNILERVYKEFPTWKQRYDDYKNKRDGFPSKMYDDIIAYVVKLCHEDKDNLYIIEGIQLAGPSDRDESSYRYTKHIKNQPLVIKGTSMLASSLRAANRNIKNGDADFGVKEYKRSIKCNSRMQKHIDGFTKAATEDVEEPVMENVILPKKDATYNFDKWKPGPNNVLFITGFMGSSKDRLATSYASKYKAHAIDLDYIEYGYDKSGMHLLDRALKEFPEWKRLYTAYQNGAAFPIRMYNAIIRRIVKLCHEDEKNLYIVQGLHLITSNENGVNCAFTDMVRDQPLIVSGTSGLQSAIRATKWHTDNPRLADYVARIRRNMKINYNMEKFATTTHFKEDKKNLDVKTLESSLPAEDRTDFGIPSLKKYPMPDAKHVKLAIKFFNYVDKEHEEELARNIKKYAKKYGVELEAGENNRFSNYI